MSRMSQMGRLLKYAVADSADSKRRRLAGVNPKIKACLDRIVQEAEIEEEEESIFDDIDQWEDPGQMMGVEEVDQMAETVAYRMRQATGIDD